MTWAETCSKVDKFLDRCDEFNISTSNEKSVWGKRSVEYLGHKISSEGIQANPKDLGALKALQFFNDAQGDAKLSR